MLTSPYHISQMAIDRANKMVVICGGCYEPAKSRRVKAIINRPQHPGVAPYAIVTFTCDGIDCQESIDLEVDLTM